jgi:hypothetical protein
VLLTAGQRKADRIAKRIHQRGDLGRGSWAGILVVSPPLLRPIA